MQGQVDHQVKDFAPLFAGAFDDRKGMHKEDISILGVANRPPLGLRRKAQSLSLVFVADTVV